MTDGRIKIDIGIGATDELSLRVSVATLVRVLFENPINRIPMLALERRATLLEKEGRQVVEVKAQPFGGAIQLRDTKKLQSFIGNFHFDSEQSRSEQDFRLFIQPSAWKQVREFCLQHFNLMDDAVLETNPRRELTEEFMDALQTTLTPDQYIYERVGTILENAPSPTENISARGYPTVRIYLAFEARIFDPLLAYAILANSEKYSDPDLRELALQDSRNGGLGRANAVLALPLSHIRTAYLSTTPEARTAPISFQDHQLDETVAAVLEDVTVPKYQRLLL